MTFIVKPTILSVLIFAYIFKYKNIFILICFVWFYGASTHNRPFGADTGKIILATATSPPGALCCIDPCYSNPFNRPLQLGIITKMI
jgi:hypothetical protein